MSQDIVFWSLSLKTKKAENVRGPEEQWYLYFSGDGFLRSISWEVAYHLEMAFGQRIEIMKKIACLSNLFYLQP